MLNVTITESAQKYLAGLLEKQNCEGIGIRMFVSIRALQKLKPALPTAVPASITKKICC